MATIHETLTNGITEGIRGIIAAGISDGTKVEAAVKELAIRQAALVEGVIEQQLDAQNRALMAAELTQGNGFTRNARPMVVYAGLAFILVVHVLIPVFGFLQGKPLNSDALPKLPQEFWWAWTGVVSVWVVGRSYEKANAPTTLSRIVTGST